MVILVHCKLNRFFRREMTHQSINFDGTVKYTNTDDEFDDFDNMFAGCAFE